MDKNIFAAIVGITSILSLLYRVTPLAAGLSAICWIWLAHELIETSAELNRFREKHEALCRQMLILTEKNRDKEKTQNNEIPASEPEKEVPVCLIKRKGIARETPENAMFVRKAPDQSPKRKMPVRSYRGDDIPEDAVKRIENKFPVIDCDVCDQRSPAAETAELRCGTEAEISPSERYVPDPAPADSNKEDCCGLTEISGDIYAQVVPEGFSEEGYMETGIDPDHGPEIV